VNLRLAAFFIPVAIGISGCVAEPEATTGREDDILDYYMPRNTEHRYLYSYKGWSSGKRDSLFHVDYRGIATLQSVTPMDGHTPIHQYTVSSTDGLRKVDIDLYVSDSVVIEYGRDCTTAAERFIPLKGKLRKGAGWQAAQAYQASSNSQISFLARVVEHYDQISVGEPSVIYNDVWQVNYEVTGNTDPNVQKEFLANARRVLYFARGIGKVYEIAYSPLNEKQWQNELLRVDRR
jgi:hypothetical protein